MMPRADFDWDLWASNLNESLKNQLIKTVTWEKFEPNLRKIKDLWALFYSYLPPNGKISGPNKVTEVV